MSNDTNNTNEEGYSLISLVTILSVAAILAIAVLSLLAGNNDCTQNEETFCVAPHSIKVKHCTVKTKGVKYKICTGGHSNGLTSCSGLIPYNCVYEVEYSGGFGCKRGKVLYTNSVHHTIAVGEDCGDDEEE